MTLSIEANHIRESVNLKLLFVPSPPQKNAGSLWTPDYDTVFMLFYLVDSDVLSMVP